MRKTVITVLLLGLLALAGLAAWAFEHGLAHFLGIDTQQSQNYDFVSGVGPMLVAVIGYTGMVATLIHSINCHEPGCLKIGRHKIDGTPWCNVHHLNARPERTQLEVLLSIEALLREPHGEQAP